MTRVLSVTSECVPLIKTGGLADVAGALPGALAGVGVEMRTLLPGYRQVMSRMADGPVHDLGRIFGGPARLRETRLGATVLYVLEAPHLYDRPGSPYLDADGIDWPDNPERFAALSFAAARIGAEGVGGWQPQVLHCHDWQAGLAPLYLATLDAQTRVATLMTVHNIAFQGVTGPDRIETLGLPAAGFTLDGYEYWGQVSTLKAGLVWADALSTVSPTYAQELLSPAFGMGLDGLLRARRADLVGILNGIDTADWTPPYKSPRGKLKYTKALRDELHLPDSDGPLAVLISRLSDQKGLDLLLEALPGFLAQGGQLALLGSGDPRYEAAFRDLAAAQPGVAVRIGYDEALSRRMVAGGDTILVPSRFEPCGLTQLYGLSHGTLPLVALTGGLADTVIDANPAGLSAGAATGVQFHPVTADALAGAFDRLLTLWQSREIWQRMMKNAMSHPVGWDVSARAYAALYESLKKTP